MKENIPQEICWRKDKIGFEPPQQYWMQQPPLQEAIHAAKECLVKEKILKPEVLGQPVLPLPAHDAANHDWRFLSASLLFK